MSLIIETAIVENKTEGKFSSCKRMTACVKTAQNYSDPRAT